MGVMHLKISKSISFIITGILGWLLNEMMTSVHREYSESRNHIRLENTKCDEVGKYI